MRRNDPNFSIQRENITQYKGNGINNITAPTIINHKVDDEMAQMLGERAFIDRELKKITNQRVNNNVNANNVNANNVNNVNANNVNANNVNANNVNVNNVNVNNVNVNNVNANNVNANNVNVNNVNVNNVNANNVNVNNVNVNNVNANNVNVNNVNANNVKLDRLSIHNRVNRQVNPECIHPFNQVDLAKSICREQKKNLYKFQNLVPDNKDCYYCEQLFNNFTKRKTIIP